MFDLRCATSTGWEGATETHRPPSQRATTSNDASNEITSPSLLDDVVEGRGDGVVATMDRGTLFDGVNGRPKSETGCLTLKTSI